MDLADQFEIFKNNSAYPFTKNYIQFLGFNITEDSDDIHMKAYFKPKTISLKSPIIDDFISLGFDNLAEYYYDDSNYKRIYSKFCLLSENDLFKFLNFIDKHTSLFEKNKKEILNFSKVKSYIKYKNFMPKSIPAYYYFGFILDNQDNVIDLKLYNTNISGLFSKGETLHTFDDEETYKQIKALGNSYLSKALDFANIFCKKNGAHFLCTGIDFTEKYNKYKQYITFQNFIEKRVEPYNTFFEDLYNVIFQYNKQNLLKNIKNIEEFILTNKYNLSLGGMGFVFRNDKPEEIALNFYIYIN